MTQEQIYFHVLMCLSFGLLGFGVAFLALYRSRWVAGRLFAEEMHKIELEHRDGREAALGRELASTQVKMHQCQHQALLARQAMLERAYAAQEQKAPQGGSLAPRSLEARRQALAAYEEYVRQGAWQWLQQAEPPDQKH